jgi:hypothetical protein
MASSGRKHALAYGITIPKKSIDGHLELLDALRNLYSAQQGQPALRLARAANDVSFTVALLYRKKNRGNN